MRRLSTTGGTLKLKKGTYKIPGTIYVPSNVKIVCANGVKIKKTKATGTKKVKSTKFLFQMISEEKASGNKIQENMRHQKMHPFREMGK